MTTPSLSGLYTAYDDKGIPTQKKGDDKPLAKGQVTNKPTTTRVQQREQQFARRRRRQKRKLIFTSVTDLCSPCICFASRCLLVAFLLFSQIKKLGKELAKHQKEHDNLQKEAGGDVEAFLAKLQAEVNELEASI